MAIDLPSLGQFHGFADGGAQWSLTGVGLVLKDAAVPETSGGPPQTVRGIWNNFGAIIVTEAARVVTPIPVELIIATIATESRGNPNAERTEPGFQSYQTTPDRVSIGLTQTLISSARSALNDPAISDSSLRDPRTAIAAGCAYIASQFGKTGYDPPKVACAYNAGGLYLNDSPNNRWKMRQFPIGTSAHADRFVRWFNDCFLLFDTPATAPEGSFVRMLNS